MRDVTKSKEDVNRGPRRDSKSEIKNFKYSLLHALVPPGNRQSEKKSHREENRETL